MSIKQEKFVFDKNAPDAPKVYPEGKGMFKIPKGHLLTPHWHPNSNEITTCSAGQGTVTIIYPDPQSPGNPGTAIHQTYKFDTEKIVFLPQGYFHYFVNTGTDDFIIHLTFDKRNFDILSLDKIASLLPENIKTTSIHSDPNHPVIPYELAQV